MEPEEEEDIFFQERRKIWLHRDRLFVSADMLKKHVRSAGLHTEEELYERLLSGMSFENIIHDCVREIKMPGELCSL